LHRKKMKEIEALEERLKLHAAVAHGQTRVLAERAAAAAASAAAKENASETSSLASASSGSALPRGSPVRMHGSVNRAHATGGTEKPLSGSAFARSLRDSQPRSILRPSSAQLRLSGQLPPQQHKEHPVPHHPQSALSARPATAASSGRASASSTPSSVRPRSAGPLRSSSAGASGLASSRGRPSAAAAAHAHDDEEEAVLCVENIDTGRSLRKTYANSVKSQSHAPRSDVGTE
jgi:hypothetical protein